MITRVLRALGIRRRKSIKFTHAYSEREARRLEMCRALFAEGKAGKVTVLPAPVPVPLPALPEWNLRILAMLEKGRGR